MELKLDKITKVLLGAIALGLFFNFPNYYLFEGQNKRLMALTKILKKVFSFNLFLHYKHY